MGVVRFCALVCSIVLATACGSGPPSPTTGPSPSPTASPMRSPRAADAIASFDLDDAKALSASLISAPSLAAAFTDLTAARRARLEVAEILSPNATQFLAEFDADQLAAVAEADARTENADAPIARLAEEMPLPEPGSREELELRTFLLQVVSEFMAEATDADVDPFSIRDSAAHGDASVVIAADHATGLLGASIQTTTTKVDGLGEDQRRLAEDLSWETTIGLCPDALGHVNVTLRVYQRLVVHGNGRTEETRSNYDFETRAAVDNQFRVTEITSEIDASGTWAGVGDDGPTVEGSVDRSISMSTRPSGQITDMASSTNVANGDELSVMVVGAEAIVDMAPYSVLVARLVDSASAAWRTDACAKPVPTPTD